MRKTLQWKNAKPSLPGSPCYCHCNGIAPHSVAATAGTAVSPLSVRHIGAARSNSNSRCLALPAYLRAARTHTLGVLMRRSYSHFRRTDMPLVLTLPAY